LYIDQFIDAGVFFHAQLLNDNNNYLAFTDFARKFEIVSDSQSFNDYIKLYLAITESWEGGELSSSNNNSTDSGVNLLNIVKQNATSI